ncbi:MAG: NADH-quinone oxidoreductase subunit NuoG, partial [Chloroflexota bacterium]
MAVIYVDNRPYEVKDGQNLLEACLGLGFDIPYFCWHPALKSVGACRQCAVKQFRGEKDTRGRIVMSCMTPAAPDIRISIDDAEARAFRAANIGWLMVNHPHDCPVCDEGGECHLQDMTVMTGHNYRQHRFKKRTYRNQYLGPFVHHEMNRCIQCYRCVRFYHDYAGGRDLNVFAAHDRVYFGREQEGTLANEFSGNLVEVCPTGVFTDETLHNHYARKWDLQSAPSICNHCGAGCNIIPGERYGTLRRIVNRYNGQVNGYFICDRGRYGYEFVNADERIRRAESRARVVGEQKPIVEASVLTDIEALTVATRIMTEATGVVGIGSPRASLEANFALRCLVGEHSFFAGFGDGERRLLDLALDIARRGPAPVPTLKQIEESDAVLVLGEDVLNTAPRVALALRQSVRQQPMAIADRMKVPRWDDGAMRRAIAGEKGPLYVATVAETGIDDIASQTYHAAPDDIARLGYAVVEALDVPPVALPLPLPDEGRPLDGTPSAVRDLARRIAESLLAAERPAVVAGTSLGSEAVLRAAADVAWALRQKGKAATLYLAVPECNSVGLALLGGGRLADALAELRSGRADTVVVLENDLYRRAEAPFVDELLNAARRVVVIDSLVNATTAKAHLLLPAATFAEGDGTLVSAEGRMQRFFQVFIASGGTRESWRWLRDLGATTGCADMGLWQRLDDLLGSIVRAFPNLAPILDVAPPASFRVAGMKVARLPERASGRTAVGAHLDVSEPKPPWDPDSP